MDVTRATVVLKDAHLLGIQVVALHVQDRLDLAAGLVSVVDFRLSYWAHRQNANFVSEPLENLVVEVLPSYHR
jgi:hypothetical protein